MIAFSRDIRWVKWRREPLSITDINVYLPLLTGDPERYGRCYATALSPECLNIRLRGRRDFSVFV